MIKMLFDDIYDKNNSMKNYLYIAIVYTAS